MDLASRLYVGTVTHHRFKPREHRFVYSLFWAYLDLSELERLPCPWWFRLNRPAPVSWYRSDYFGDPNIPLDTAIRQLVEQQTGQSPTGPVRMLAHLRYFGYCYNPVTFYYCFEPDGKTLHSVVSEITNTPWHERFQYVLPIADAMSSEPWKWEMPKRFHVSPFMTMDFDYDWQFGYPGDDLTVGMINRRDGDTWFGAGLDLSARPFTSRELLRLLMRFPFMTGKVVTAIYWNALRLWLKRIPFVPHPKRAAEVSS